MNSNLRAALETLARVPILLVATDFDGTIAPIVSDPAAAEADREAMTALKALAAMPQTHVAVISGRALGDLAARTRDLEHAHLVGSHGSEYETGLAEALSPDAAALRGRLADYLRGLAGKHQGLHVEEKPAAFALHYRNAPTDAAAAAVGAVEIEPARWPGVHVRHGKMVVELSVVEINKGVALKRIRQRLGATAVLFIGDDQTDEDAFATLSGPDLGIKLGESGSSAPFRVDGIPQAAQALAVLAECRAAWLAGAQATPIEKHALLSDQRTIALLDPSGRVVWMCMPRLDSAALFAELLGGPTAGFFAIEPVDATAPVSQQYKGDSFVLETTWPTLRVTDYLDCGAGRPYQRAGRTDLVRVISGTGRVRVTYAPRLDFGRVETRLTTTEQGVAVDGAVDSIVLLSPQVQWRLTEEGRHHTAIAEFDLSDEPVTLELRYGTASFEPDYQPELTRRERTQQFWSMWTGTLAPPMLAAAAVKRSALILKALSYGPTGAIAAAATTSLPEHAGGARNWDYRFCWPRDAAIAATALLQLGSPGAGLRLLDWLLGILDRGEPGSLMAPLYTVTGAHCGAEGEIAELSGYLGSRPVRIGNAAAQQVQLDVFGPVADLVARLAKSNAPLSSEHWRLTEAMVTAVQRRWREPDHGIWEVRRPRQHHVHSKVMCWQTVDRALIVARYLGRKSPEWAALRDEIAVDILTHGWNEKHQAFCATYEGHEPDASALSVGLSGLLRPDDSRFVSTLNFVERELRRGPTVYRYSYDDFLPGQEGGFTLCTTWLIEAYLMAGRREDALQLFEALLQQVGPTGLLSEEFDPESMLALGNVPQLYSHAGLINAAIAIESASSTLRAIQIQL